MNEQIDTNLIQGDNTGAFGQHLMRIYLRDPYNLLQNHSISKCEIRFACGVIKTFLNPKFPLIIDLTEEESNKMKVGNNTAVMAVWDELGRKVTPKGSQVVSVGSRKV